MDDLAQSDFRPTTLTERFVTTRNYTEMLCKSLSEEDCQIQSMPDASPTKWHLAHTTWFWETFLLPELSAGYTPFNEQYGFLFNSYYEAVGPRHARPNRGMITRPGLSDILTYRKTVTERVVDALETCGNGLSSRALTILETGLAHEEQHQELLLTDIKHALFQNPFPTGLKGVSEFDDHEALPQKWIGFEGGLVAIGDEGAEFTFDNEGPVHQQFLAPYSLSNTLVTNKMVLDFIEDGGYQTSSLWLSDGWVRINAEKRVAPLYWFRDEHGAWQQYTLAGVRELSTDAPASHLDFYEANAIADWCGARLSTEFEWEHAVRTSVERLTDCFGKVWQWTRSDYAPYPGYAIADGAIGEYNGKFMSNQYVLRGSSCATTPGHERVTYRNFFPAHAQWQFTGVRLAKS